MLTLRCEDLRRVRPFDCCGSCHNDDEFDPFDHYPAESRPHRHERWWPWIKGARRHHRIVLYVCCTGGAEMLPTGSAPLTRGEWAKMARSARYRNRVLEGADDIPMRT